MVTSDLEWFNCTFVEKYVVLKCPYDHHHEIQVDTLTGSRPGKTICERYAVTPLKERYLCPMCSEVMFHIANDRTITNEYIKHAYLYLCPKNHIMRLRISKSCHSENSHLDFDEPTVKQKFVDFFSFHKRFSQNLSVPSVIDF